MCEISNIKLKPCPFCGGDVKIIVCDDEGNNHPEEYEEDPWSGLGYHLQHGEKDNLDCPVAHWEGENLGTFSYDTREEAIETWNKRVGSSKQPQTLNNEKYILIEVIERDISQPEFFDTHDEAHDKMCLYMAAVLDETVDEIKKSGLVESNSAWCERHGDNFDWKIFRVQV